MNIKIQRKKAKYYDCTGVSMQNMPEHIKSRDFWENDPRIKICDSEIIFQRHYIHILKNIIWRV